MSVEKAYANYRKKLESMYVRVIDDAKDGLVLVGDAYAYMNGYNRMLSDIGAYNSLVLFVGKLSGLLTCGEWFL